MKRSVRQAEVSKREADANIDRKLNVLNGWIATGIPYQEDDQGNTLLGADDRKLLDYYPTSLRQFKAWDGSQNCFATRRKLPIITATGNDTLAKRPSAEEQARRLIAALKERARAQALQTHPSEVKRLTQALRVAELTIGIRIAELREQQRELRRIERENIRLLAKLEGDATEFKRVHIALAAELAHQKEENALLISQLHKLRPLYHASASPT